MNPNGEDEFGLSSSDEAELAAIADDPTSSPVVLKRKEQDDLQGDTKRVCLDHDSIALQTATRILQQRFGLEHFRLKQAAAITRVLEGGSSVVVFPTGQLRLKRPLYFSDLISKAVASLFATRYLV